MKAVELEETSSNVSKEVGNQSDKLKYINRNVVDLSEDLNFSESLIRRILRRGNRNKLIIGVLSVVLFIIIVIIIIVKVSNK